MLPGQQPGTAGSGYSVTGGAAQPVGAYPSYPQPQTTSGPQPTGLGYPPTSSSAGTHGAQQPGAAALAGASLLGTQRAAHHDHPRNDIVPPAATYPSEAQSLPPQPPGAISATPYFEPHGHHHTFTAEMLDPHVDQDHHHHPHASRDSDRVGVAGSTLAGPRDPHDSSSGPTTSTTGPHKSNILNKLDPRVDSDLDGSRGPRNTDNQTTGHTGLTGSGHPVVGRSTDHSRPDVHHGDYADPYQHYPAGSIGQKPIYADARTDDHLAHRDHHHGRHAALAGGIAAAGATAHEAERRPRGTDGLPEPSVHRAATHPTEPSVESIGTAHHDQHKHDKDGKHGLLSFLHKDEHNGKDATSTPVPAPTASRDHTVHDGHKHEEKRHSGLLGFLHKDDDKHKGADTHPSDRDHHNHHHGRDAALAGGAVGAGTAAYDAGRHPRGTDSLPGSVPHGDTTGAGGSATHDHHHDKGDGKHGLLGFLHRGDDKHKSTDVHPSGHDHHHGRDVALAGGAAGAGATAYEAGRHPRGTDGLPGSTPPRDTTGASSTTAHDHHHDAKNGKHGLLGFLHKGDDKHKGTDVHPSSHEHHHSRDVALAGGAAGATGYDAGRHPHGTDGLPGSVPPRDTTGASSAATHDRQHDAKDGKHGLLGFLHKGDDKSKRTDTHPSHPDHHHGRDAVLAGSATAAGATMYEVGKHHRGTDGLPSAVPTNETATPAGTTAGPADPALYDQHQQEKEGKRSGLLGFLHKDDDKSKDKRRDVVTEEPKEEKRHGLFGTHHDDDKHKDKHHDKVKEKEKEKHHGGLFGSHHDDDKHKDKHHDKVKEKEKEDKHHGGLFGTHHDDDKHKDKHHDKVKEKEEKHHGGLFGSHHDDDDGKHKDKHHKEKTKEKEDKHHGGLFGTHHDDDKHKDKHHDKAKEKEKEKEKDEKHHGGLLGFLHHDKDKTKEKHHDDDATAHHDTTAAAAEGDRHGHGHHHQHHERNRLHKDPPKDYLAKMQGGMGTGGDVASDATAANERGVVTEPHTGLPMDVGRYGSGAGGTDGGPAPGYHRHEE